MSCSYPSLTLSWCELLSIWLPSTAPPDSLFKSLLAIYVALSLLKLVSNAFHSLLLSFVIFTRQKLMRLFLIFYRIQVIVFVWILAHLVVFGLVFASFLSFLKRLLFAWLGVFCLSWWLASDSLPKVITIIQSSVVLFRSVPPKSSSYGWLSDSSLKVLLLPFSHLLATVACS